MDAAQASENLISLSNQDNFEITSTHSDYDQPLTYLYDENPYTDWSNILSPYYSLDVISIDFDFPVEATSFEVNAVNNKSLRLEYFDGTDWQLAGEFATQNSAVSYTLTPTIAQRWRLRNFKNTSDNDPATITIDDIALFGSFLPQEPQKNLLDGEIVVELAQAPVDECHESPGSENNIYPKPEGVPCPEGTVEKRNEAYLWSIAKHEDENIKRIYFGTGANVFCIGTQTYLGLSDVPISVPGSFACQNGVNTDKPIGDQRPPSIFMYDILTEELSEPELDQKTKDILDMTIGLRSGGQHEGIIFLSGPNFNNSITIVALNGATGELIDSTSLDFGFTSSRKTSVTGGELYFAVGAAESVTPTEVDALRRKGGGVLRWLGDAQAVLAGDTSTLFDFEIVGTNLDAEAAEINTFEGKAIVSTWPNVESTTGGGLWQKDFPLSTDATNTANVWNAGESFAYRMTFKANGNLELYNFFGFKIYETGTANQGADKLVLQDNGVLAIYTADDTLLWTSTTFNPYSKAVNSISIENATTLPLGYTLRSGSSVKSANGHVTLALTGGDLRITEKQIKWTRVWGAEEFDPDPFVATTYGISTTIQKDGWLYWGSLHVPGSALGKFIAENGAALALPAAPLLVPNFHRATTFFRGRNLGQANEEIELLYGGSYFFDGAPVGHYPVHQFDTIFGVPYNLGVFKYEQNKMGLTPKFGREGFGNTLNQYLWNMVEYNGDIYLGTFDQGGLSDEFFFGSPLQPNFTSIAGADVYKLDTDEMAVQPVFLDGATTELSYGIRNSIVVGDELFLGTASNSSLDPDGGWRLLKVTAEELAE